MMTFAAVLLAAVAAGQPLIGPEVVLRTTSPAPTYHPAPQAVPLVADGDGYVVTWSEVIDGLSRAYAGRLDGAGRLTAVGVRTAGTADAAVIAPLGGGYVAAWLEPTGPDGRPGLVSAALDRDFRIVSSHAADFLSETPRLRAGGGHVYVAIGSAFYEIDAGGGRNPVFFAPLPIDDFAVAGSEVGLPVAYVARRVATFPGFSPFTPAYSISELHFDWPLRTGGPLTASLTLTPQKIDLPMAIGSDGSGFLVTWFDPRAAAVMGSLIAPFTHFQFSPFVVSAARRSRVDTIPQACVVSDGSRWLVIWELDGRIEGMTVAPGGARTTFTVSTIGSRPAVATARQGSFVVTYEVFEGVNRRLASRLLDFNPEAPPGRERAVR